ncbi:MAG: glycosyltransferase family 9 protein [bacterium]
MADQNILVCFPCGEAPGLQADAAQLALGHAECGCTVTALGPLGPWRYALRQAGVTANEFALPCAERKIADAVKEIAPQLIHAFGAETAQLMLPQALLAGVPGVVTLGHNDLSKIVPTVFRTASAVFVPCEYLREQVSRRLPAVPVVTTGYLVPPTSAIPTPNYFLSAELGVPDGAPLVLLADQFNGAETEVALELFIAGPMLADRVPNLNIIIAGGGGRLAELEERANEVNNQLGRRMILLPGYREDVPQLLALATVAVGSGRFAAEAVGAGVALVAAGGSGMVGTLTEDTQKAARYTCCGRHGRLTHVTAHDLAREIAGLFNYPDYRAAFARDNQARMLEGEERATRAAQLTIYYQQGAPTGAITRTPQRITALLPDDLRELLFILPALAALVKQFPLAQLKLISTARHGDFLRAIGLAERVQVKPEELLEWPVFLGAMYKPRADAALVFSNDIGSGLLAGYTWAKHRYGFNENGAAFLLTDHIRTDASISPARAQALVQAIGVAEGARVPVPELPQKAKDAAQRTLLARGIVPSDTLVLLCPAAVQNLAWPNAHWEELVQALQADGVCLAVLEPCEVQLPVNTPVLSFPKDTLELAALLNHASVVVASDSSVLHMADLLEIPAVGIYGPTTPEDCTLPLLSGERRPLCRDMDCRPCPETPCAERVCLQAITPEEVITAIKELVRL